jgi:integrase
VNGRAVPIREQLRNGDIVEILTQKNQQPKSDWLNFVVTQKAKQKIKSVMREEQAKATSTDSYICIKPNRITDNFRNLRKRLGIRQMRFYDLRHYLVSVMLSLNIPKKYIADYVGHEDEAMIDRVYGHIMARRKTSVEDMMYDYFSDIFPPK